MLFLGELAFRATATVWVATSADAAPPWFAPVRDWAAALYWAYMVLSYLAVAASGAAILQADAGWLWWLADIPGLLYLVTGGIGVALLAT